jgi:hypothetical protein
MPRGSESSFDTKKPIYNIENSFRVMSEPDFLPLSKIQNIDRLRKAIGFFSMDDIVSSCTRGRVGLALMRVDHGIMQFFRPRVSPT